MQRRFVQAPVVDEVLRGGVGDTFERLRSRFVSAIHSLSDEEAALLLDVFALSPDTEHLPRLMQRRAVHGRKIGRGIDTVAAREDSALQRLHHQLVTGRYTQSPLTIDVPEMHGGIVYEHTSTLIVVEDRRWRETREYYRFVATFDEMDYLTISRSYPAHATPHPGGAFKVNTRPVDGAGWNDHFWHLNPERTATAPMKRGKAYDLRFTLTPDPDDENAQSPMTLASRAFHERSLLASIQVAFVGEPPRDVWTYERVSPFARPHTANDYNRVHLDERGVATLRLRDVYGGLFSGMGWEWG